MYVWLMLAIAALIIYIAQIGAITWLEHRRQSHLAAWIFLCLVCPYLGFAAYWLLGRRLKRVKPLTALKSECHAASKIGKSAGMNRFHSFMEQHLPYPATNRNRATVLQDGETTFQTILNAIEHACSSIHLDYYTVRCDGIGSRFLEALTSKAREGVDVKLLYDGIGSLHLSEHFLQKLHSSGAQSACFSPPREFLLKKRLNFRNHRKIVVIDNSVGFMGGINIGDEYLGLDPRLGFWRDTHLKLEGECVRQLQTIFQENWLRATGENIRVDAGSTSRDEVPAPEAEWNDRIVLVPGKPGIHDAVISEALFAAMSEAKETIYAVTPYFIPDPSIAASLRIAARSGVDVKMIIPGISDSKLVLLATLSYVQDMLDAGVRVYRYGKGFIHAKVLIIDGRLASIGSANLDMRSLYTNYELLALIEGADPVGRLTKDFMTDLSDSVAVDAGEFSRRPAKQKTAESLLHLLSPLL
ncbi:cardiolipin synthase [Paenibacillus sp. MY03]|uniref:cardiolipin synthase n=1 Tax=Paenibacillus sp. MY03 TaxID=302980 RepID=UPI000B3C6AD2|nr:cardiolipin synthase [Paenibacillus sp. MY03]OUS72671.1 cardiolipin synthase [Paenibacillus sp. MY03]